MDRVTSTVIDVVEAAYDVGPDDAAWFPTLLEVGDRLFEKGFGTGIRVVERPVDGGPIKNRELYTSPNMPSDWNETVLAMFQVLPPKFLEIRSRPGTAHTQSELWSIYQDERERLGYFGDYSDVGAMPGAEVIQKAVALGHKDALIVTAVDPYGVGFYFSLHLPEVTTLTEKERARWRMLAAHLTAGFRLRHGLSDEGVVGSSELPGGAEAILDPKDFRVTDASGRASDTSAIETLREAAIRVDRARGRLRKNDPEESLEVWWALLNGRWSFVDWFDTDGRRFVLAHPNAPNVGDPRGLTEREAQVVAFAALGETGKLISYRIGVSVTMVSRALRSAMHKLGVKTQAQLAGKLRGLPDAHALGDQARPDEPVQ